MRKDGHSTEEVTMGRTTKQRESNKNEELPDGNKSKSTIAIRRDNLFISLAGGHMKETCQYAAQTLRLGCGI